MAFCRDKWFLKEWRIDKVRDMYFADDMTPCVELVGGRVTFTEKFGKTVFLSREEAEKALRGMEGKKDG